MNFSKIHPFIRFIHYLPLTPEDQYSFTTPYDNRLFYVHAGTEKIAAAGRIYTLSEGDMLIIPSGTEYRLLSPEAPVTLIGVNFDYTQNHIDKQKPIPPIDPADFTPDQQLETLSFRDFDEFNGVVYLSGMQSAAERLLTMEREYTAKFLCYEQIISGLFTEVLVECLRTLRRQKFCGNAGLILSIIGITRTGKGKRAGRGLAIAGAIIRSNVPWGKAALFYATTGNNGKGTLAQFYRNLCGANVF